MTGRAEPIRLAFYLGGVPFEDCRISKDEFAAMRGRGELLYGQLPIMFVDEKKYTQSIALLRFGGQLAGLYPECETEALRCDMVRHFATIHMRNAHFFVRFATTCKTL